MQRHVPREEDPGVLAHLGDEGGFLVRRRRSGIRVDDPLDRLEEGSLGALHRFEVRALVGDGLVAEGMLVLAIARGNAAAATS